MSEGDELPAGVRPPSLGEPPGPAVRVGRGQQPRTIEQPSLDVPVLQMVDHLIDVLGFFGTLVPDVAEQVIEVPKISTEDGNLQRASLRAPQLVEQLVEVPTFPFFRRADHRQSGSGSWCFWTWRSSRFSSRTEF